MPSPAEPHRSRFSARFIAYCGVLVAVAAIFSYIEALFPLSLAVPGIKLGLANIVVLFALYTLGWRSALLISLLRILLVSSLFGNLMMALYSAAGATVSLLGMLLLQRSGRFSLLGVSLAGGVLHNMAQLLVAAAVSSTVAVLAYMPVLILVGMLTGLLIGVAAAAVLQRIGGLPHPPESPRSGC